MGAQTDERLKNASVGNLIDEMETLKTSITSSQERLDLVMDELRARKYRLPALPRRRRRKTKDADATARLPLDPLNTGDHSG
jgi:hypothetical protein